MKDSMKYLLPLMTTLATLPGWLTAEEGGSGHYLPGAISSFLDGTPDGPALITRFNGLSYQGDYTVGPPLPFAANAVANVKASSYAAGVTVCWRPDVTLPDGWSYAMNATIPYVWMEVEATVSTGQGNIRRSDRVDGIGDIVVMPAQVSYAINADLHLDGRLGVYAPTGDYQVGRLANLGKNYWTIEPTIGVLYLGKGNGIEGSLYAGIDFNTENPDTHFQTGTQVHLDGTLAQHLPLAGGLAGIGVTGFYYKQIVDDSGSGVLFPNLRGMTTGLGPVLSYVAAINAMTLLIETKWSHEIDTEARLAGDYVWLKAALKF